MNYKDFGVFMTCFQMISHHLVGGTEENHEELQSG